MLVAPEENEGRRHAAVMASPMSECRIPTKVLVGLVLDRLLAMRTEAEWCAQARDSSPSEGTLMRSPNARRARRGTPPAGAEGVRADSGLVSGGRVPPPAWRQRGQSGGSASR